MILINTDKMFEEAIKEQSIDIVENLLQCADSKCELMKNYSKENDVSNLLCLLCDFRSKGLVMNIETLCFQHNNFKDHFVGINNFKNEKITLQHIENKKSNEIKHLRGGSFKTKAKPIYNKLDEDKVRDKKINFEKINRSNVIKNLELDFHMYSE